MINRRNSSFFGLILIFISSCGPLNYGVPNFVSTESENVERSVDSLQKNSDFSRLFNEVYASEQSPINNRLSDTIAYLNEVPTKVDSTKLSQKSGQKAAQTVIYAETINIYQTGNKNDSIVIEKYNSLMNDSIRDLVETMLRNPANEQISTINIKDLSKPISKNDTSYNHVYITDTIRTQVPIITKNPVSNSGGSNRIDTVFSKQIDTVYLVDESKRDSLFKVINDLKNRPPLTVRDTVSIVEPIPKDPIKPADTVFVKEIETVYQTITDTVRVQEVKEILSKPVIIEKKPTIREFTISFEKNTSKGDNFETEAKSILEICSKSKNYVVFLAGYTDKSGSESANLIMSQKRATSIRDQLIGRGIDELKIVTQWFGEKFATQENSASERIVKVRIEIRD